MVDTGLIVVVVDTGIVVSSPPRRNKGTINYPSNAPQNRDYLCIKCIKLI